MAAPTVVTSATDGAGSGTGGAIALPSGIQAGDKLVVLVNINNSTFSTTVTGWTKIVDYSFVPVLSLTPRIGIFVRDADGTETTFAQTWISSVKWSSVSYRISGSDSVTNFVLSTEHTASDSTADANNLAPGSTKDWLWIYLGGSQNTYTVASPATGYTNLLSATSAGGGSANSKATCWSCTKGTTATSSEDPPAWSLGTAVGHAEWVLAVPPVGAQVYTDAATVYLTLTPSGTDEYTPAPAPDSDNLFSQPRVYMEQAIRSHWRARKF